MKKKAVILLNLGGPDSLAAVRPFLYNLFSDREIIRLGPSFMQKPLAFLISTIRTPKTRKAYSLIGGRSPILQITRMQAEKLHRALEPHGEFKVYVGMKYWHPFIKDAIREAIEDGAEMIIGLSLYPQYSKATTGSTKRDFDYEIAKHRIPVVRFIKSWYNHPLYIQAMKELILEKIRGLDTKDFHLLFSAHSLPVSFIKEGDPYEKEIHGTVEAIVNALKDSIQEIPVYSISYQSRTGPVKWLGPSTDEEIIR
ncbi:MAG: ferrochelatase, partial [Nitrospirae bacterium]|nr:ferrochelatase [Nitrospirota bacterium]